MRVFGLSADERNYCSGFHACDRTVKVFNSFCNGMNTLMEKNISKSVSAGCCTDFTVDSAK